MENLLNDNKRVILYTNLAAKLGLNEAIMLQQIHFWLQKSKHVKDGRQWVFNTYQDWQEQLPFWSINTIKRVILKLEKEGYLLSANYNRLKLDKTKWYSIDYEKIAELGIDTDAPTDQNGASDVFECSAEEQTLGQALPKGTTNNTLKINKDDQSCENQTNHLDEEVKTNDSELDDVIDQVFPNGLKKDRRDSIYRLYNPKKMPLSVYKRILLSVSENMERISRFEKYLQKAIENELSSKQKIPRHDPKKKKYIREEMVPDGVEIRIEEKKKNKGHSFLRKREKR